MEANIKFFKLKKYLETINNINIDKDYFLRLLNEAKDLFNEKYISDNVYSQILYKIERRIRNNQNESKPFISENIAIKIFLSKGSFISDFELFITDGYTVKIFYNDDFYIKNICKLYEDEAKEKLINYFKSNSPIDYDAIETDCEKEYNEIDFSHMTLIYEE